MSVFKFVIMKPLRSDGSVPELDQVVITNAIRHHVSDVTNDADVTFDGNVCTVTTQDSTTQYQVRACICNAFYLHDVAHEYIKLSEAY